MKTVKFSTAQSVFTAYSAAEYDRSNIMVDQLNENDYVELVQYLRDFHPITNYNVEVTKSWRYLPSYYHAQSFIHDQIKQHLEPLLNSVKPICISNSKWNIHAPEFVP
jgi:hypothetical protein